MWKYLMKLHYVSWFNSITPFFTTVSFSRFFLATYETQTHTELSYRWGTSLPIDLIGPVVLKVFKASIIGILPCFRVCFLLFSIYKKIYIFFCLLCSSAPIFVMPGQIWPVRIWGKEDWLRLLSVVDRLWH